MDRGRWLDPKGAELTVAEWSEEFLRLSRRLSPTIRATYRQDLERYLLPRFAAYRIGRLPADEIENFLMDEVAAGIASSSVRSITVSSFTATVLAEHLERFALPGPDGLVFTNTAGNPLISSSFHSHAFGPALARVGLACRFHDLRHTSVALAIAAGAHPKAIQHRMGHSSINVTLDRYGHLFPELDEAIAVAFGERLAETHERRASTVVHAAFGH